MLLLIFAIVIMSLCIGAGLIFNKANQLSAKLYELRYAERVAMIKKANKYYAFSAGMFLLAIGLVVLAVLAGA